MIWAQILVGGLVSGIVFLKVNARVPRSRVQALAAVLLFAGAMTAAIAAQAGHRGGSSATDVAKVAALALVMSVEGLLVARWVVSAKLPPWLKLFLYLVVMAVAGVLTLALVAAFAVGS